MQPLRRNALAPRTRRAATVAAVLLATGGLTACTAQQNAQTEEFTGAKGEVQSAIERFSTLADRGDATRICAELLGDALKTALGGQQCAQRLEAAIDGADYTSLNVASVDVDKAGTTAIARIDPATDEADDVRRAITLSRAGEKEPWKIVALDPSGKTALAESVSATSTTPAQTSPEK